jgi:hypothetical protein
MQRAKVIRSDREQRNCDTPKTFKLAFLRAIVDCSLNGVARTSAVWNPGGVEQRK